MGRIGVRISGIERTLLNRLAESQAATELHALRLATGSKAPRPRDNPSAFLSLGRSQTRLSTINRVLENVASASSIVSQIQVNLAQIRTQLDTIRVKALEDENQGLSAQDRATNQAEIDTAVAEINRLATTDINGRRFLDGSANFSVQGRDPSQIRRVEVLSVGPPGTAVAAEPAELVYTGSNQQVAADATIRVRGELGTQSLSVDTAQSLKEVARAVNAQTKFTGVEATAKGNQLFLNSSTLGADAEIEVIVDSGTFAVTGGNGDGTAQGVDREFATLPAIAGRVLEPATRAELTYTGVAGEVTADATFTLTGNRGSATISVSTNGGSPNDTLLEVADRINLESHLTGVTAAAAGDTLTLSSIDFGSDALVQIDVTSGTFIQGSPGTVSDNGTDIIASINGQTLQGQEPARAAELIHTGVAGKATQAASFQLSGALGTQTINVAQDEDLTSVRDSINAVQNLTGVSATVEINDLVFTSTATGATSFVELERLSGSFDVFTENGLSLQTNIAAQPAILTHITPDGTIQESTTFDLTGTGTSAITLNVGDSLLVARDTINLDQATTGIVASVSGNSLVLTSQATGASAITRVDNVVAGTFAVIGGDVTGTAQGVNALARVEGLDAVEGRAAVRGNRVILEEGKGRYQIEFAEGFSGKFNTVTILPDAVGFSLSTNVGQRSFLPIPSLLSSELGGSTGALSQLVTGGSLSGLNTNAPLAVRVVDEALGFLDRVEGRVNGFANSAIASSSSLLTAFQEETQAAIDRASDIDEEEEQLLLDRQAVLFANTQVGLELISQQRSDLVSMLRRVVGLA